MRKWVCSVLLLFILIQLPADVFCQRTGYSSEAFARRRARLFEQVSEGIIILFGECHLQPAAHFRQDNDFYYFTGVEDPHTILVMEQFKALLERTGGTEEAADLERRISEIRGRTSGQ